MAQVLLRLSDSLKQRISILAELDDVSLNQWIATTLAEKAGTMQKELSLAAKSKKRKTFLSKTARGSAFEYTPDSTGRYFIKSGGETEWEIPSAHFDFAQRFLKSAKRVELGASRTEPKKGSFGRALLDEFGVNYASFIAPILRDADECEIEHDPAGGNGFVVTAI